MAHIEVNYDRWVFLFDAQLNAAESNQNMCVDSFKALVVFQRHLMDSIMSLNRYFLLCKIGFSGVNRNGFLLPAYSLFKQLMDVSDSFMKRLATVLQTSPRQKELMDIVKKTSPQKSIRQILFVI